LALEVISGDTFNIIERISSFPIRTRITRKIFQDPSNLANRIKGKHPYPINGSIAPDETI
jgi:hypothetical protein